jgi:DNA-binding MarR family transcriptional regulator
MTLASTATIAILRAISAEEAMPDTVDIISMVKHRIDLHPRQIAVMAVARAPRRHIGDVPCELRLVAKYLNMAPPPVVRAVDKLAIMGLMRRTRVKHDQRRVILSVTAEGDRVLDALESGTRPDVLSVFMDAA